MMRLVRVTTPSGPWPFRPWTPLTRTSGCDVCDLFICSNWVPGPVDVLTAGCGFEHAHLLLWLVLIALAHCV